MPVASRTRVTCPRCGTAVTGEFKFCPACACRLKPGVGEEAAAGPAPRSWRARLLPLLAGTALGGLVAWGWYALSPHEPEPEPPAVRTRPYRVLPGDRLTMATLPSYLVAVPDGTAYGVDGAPGEPRTMRTRPLRVLVHEVTNALYQEFHESVEAQVERGEPPPQALQDLWQPATEEGRVLARLYLGAWVQAVRQHLAGEGAPDAALPDALQVFLPEAERSTAGGPSMPYEEAVAFPWPHELGLLLMAPPAWTRVDSFGRLIAQMPEGTEALPVTGVAYPDATAFAQWATEQVGGDLTFRLPVLGEWIRIAHGDHPPERLDDPRPWYPWGASVLVQACNNRDAYLRVERPSLRAVDVRYRGYDLGGDQDDRTVDGVFNMAGNAREWVQPPSRQRRRAGDDYVVAALSEAEVRGVADPAARLALRLQALTAGGSYLKPIEECTVTSTDLEEPHRRAPDIGFRLVAEAPL